ncbi:MAG: hypothetical protein KJ800_00070, partial [Proteobacteria bacterium]|nr:hypothetical protein [Pseudomonadota bacterium]
RIPATPSPLMIRHPILRPLPRVMAVNRVVQRSAAILDVILKLPPVKQAMASRRIKSLCLEALITKPMG